MKRGRGRDKEGKVDIHKRGEKGGEEGASEKREEGKSIAKEVQILKEKIITSQQGRASKGEIYECSRRRNVKKCTKSKEKRCKH